jgi:hypothetical protein
MIRLCRRRALCAGGDYAFYVTVFVFVKKATEGENATLMPCLKVFY